MLVAVALLSFALDLRHFEQAAVGFGAAIAGSLLARAFGYTTPIRLSLLIAGLLAVLAARAGFMLALNARDIPIENSRVGYFADHRWEMIFKATKVFPMALWSALGAVWLVIIKLWDMGRPGAAPTLSVLLLALVIWTVLDHTRV